MRRTRLSVAVTVLLASILAGTSIAGASGPRSDNPKFASLDKAVDAAALRFLENQCHAGLSISVVTPDGNRIYGFGVSDRTTGAPPKPDSLYEIASVTKTFTASLAAYAVHEGKMDLNGDFRRYLDESYPNLAYNSSPITLSTLLTHRSGMPRDIPDTDAVFAVKDPHTLPKQLLDLARGIDEKAFFHALHDTRLRGAPGAAEWYSNAGYQLVGVGLGHVYHEPYATLLQQRILAPRAMTSTTLTPSPSQLARRVTGYDILGNVAPDHPDNAGAAWGLWSTPADLAKYVSWQLDTNDPIVSLSHRPLAQGDGEDIAMGWHLEHLDGRNVISHGGGSFGTSSQIVLFPDDHEGFALLANDTCQGTESALKSLAIGVKTHAP